MHPNATCSRAIEPGSEDNGRYQDRAARERDPPQLVQRAGRRAHRAAAAAASGHRPADRPGRSGAAVPDGPDPAGGLDRARDRRSPTRCWTCCGCGGRRRSTAPTAWSARWAPARASTTSTRASRRPARTSRTPPSPRPTTTPGPAAADRDRDRRRPVGQLDGARLQLFGLECKVYMVRVSYDQKPYRRMMMETWGAAVVPSPSPDTNAGRGSARGARPTRRGASASPSPRRSRMPPPARTRATRWARC